MATHRLGFTVLCPNGRRQKLTVPSNASCLQVLEDACKKQNLNPEDYDLKHYNKKVDLSLSVRFANFPNNALLELHPTEHRRTEKAVTIGLQLESGERLMHEFLPLSTLWEIISYWHNENKLKNDDEKNQPVCIYMRRELIGKDVLEKTTLRDLGLTSGRAIIRLLYREPESLKEQAHVEVPLTRPYIPLEHEELSTEINSGNYVGSKENEKVITNNGVYIESSSSLHNERTNSTAFRFKQDMVSALKRKQNVTGHSDDTSKISKDDTAEMSTQESEKDDHHQQESNDLLTDVEMEEVEEKPIYIGGRNAVLFNREDIPAWKPEDIPDQFYELTIDDACYILNDLIRQRKELEERPLETAALREARQLELASKYQYTVIRVYFPERFVLQALFSPAEKIGDVMEFLRPFLSKKETVFSLYTTPPKQVLLPDMVLYQVGLIPTAVLHFTSPEKKESYLSDHLMTQVSSPAAAHQAAFPSRKKRSGSS